LLGDERLGVEKVSSPRKIVIDFGSPNVAKPIHVGHIRSTFLGDALARIAEFLGHDVIRDNHIGDWGTQFGMVIWGWKNLLNLESLKRDPIAELVRIYKETNERATQDEAVREAARAELVKLQAGDRENYSIWKQCVDLSMQEFSKAYELLDIHYDIVRGESFITTGCRRWLIVCSKVGWLKSARARSAFSSAIFPSWRISLALFAKAMAATITPPPIWQRLITASTI